MPTSDHIPASALPQPDQESPHSAPHRTVSGNDPSDRGLPRWAAPLRPLVDAVAGIEVGVYAKLLTGFLIGALLLLGMAILSLFIIQRMSQRMDELQLLQEKVDRASRMEYVTTAQGHFRAMALLTHDDTNNAKIAEAKGVFGENLDRLEQIASPDQRDILGRLRSTNERFATSSARVLDLYQNGQDDEAMTWHLIEEHSISHELETDLRLLQREVGREMAAQRAAFEGDRGLLLTIGILFSVISLVTAVGLGLVLSGAFILPVRRIETMLSGIAAGDFTRQLSIPNRDEFGRLSTNLNRMSAQLATLYAELQAMNRGLQVQVEEQVKQLERAGTLRRYLSPQLAESILDGTLDVSGASRRRNLTIFFSDIRGFTETSEHVEPEELIDLLNRYLTTMTEIVFQYGGTLDKYIGDAVMVFFGDPMPYQDHAERAVRMAFEMRRALVSIQTEWQVRLGRSFDIGMGISTGYVTVGNIGSSARAEYTVIGNHVNLASRLADRAEPGQILISDRTLEAVRDLVEATEIDQVQLEGVSRPVKIYAVREQTAVATASPS